LDTSCQINYDTQNVFIEFEIPKFAVAPGQSIVFYDQDICIGGGFIESRANKNIL
jgi:tRNA-specific 2-thiouridylase